MIEAAGILGAAESDEAGESDEAAESAETSGSVTDAALVREAQRGRAEAFEALVRRHLQGAHAVAFALVGDSDDAEDVCQDAFIAALKQIRQCREPEKFRAWLQTIVRNRAHNFRAHRARRRSMPEGADVLGSAGAGPALGAAQAELRGHLASAVETLTELQRAVLLRFDLEGWTHREIADALGISTGASRFHLHVARRAMRRRLSGLYGNSSVRISGVRSATSDFLTRG